MAKLTAKFLQLFIANATSRAVIYCYPSSAQTSLASDPGPMTIYLFVPRQHKCFEMRTPLWVALSRAEQLFTKTALYTTANLMYVRPRRTRTSKKTLKTGRMMHHSITHMHICSLFYDYNILMCVCVRAPSCLWRLLLRAHRRSRLRGRRWNDFVHSTYYTFIVVLL
jgi:hypothetical protein